MKHRTRGLLIPGALLLAACATRTEHPSDWDTSDPRAEARTVEHARVTDTARITATWPERPRLAVAQMTAAHGPPTVVSSHALVWLDVQPFERIMVVSEEIPHDFPKPHMDFLTHTVAYEVPLDRVQDVLAFDGSLLVDRTAGELSARCDTEAHNILALNLAHDVASGAKSVEEARRAFADAVVAELTQAPPRLLQELAFRPAPRGAAFLDEPVIPGAPRRAGTRPVEASAGRDDSNLGEVLAHVIVLDENEVLAALAAKRRADLPEDVRAYADMLYEQHGRNLARTMELGVRLGVVPVETRAVDQFRRQGAGQLASVLALEGEAFAAGFVDAMVQGHQQALALIERRLLPGIQRAEVREALEATREAVTRHLAEGRRLQDERGR